MSQTTETQSEYFARNEIQEGIEFLVSGQGRQYLKGTEVLLGNLPDEATKELPMLAIAAGNPGLARRMGGDKTGNWSGQFRAHGHLPDRGILWQTINERNQEEVDGIGLMQLVVRTPGRAERKLDILASLDPVIQSWPLDYRKQQIAAAIGDALRLSNLVWGADRNKDMEFHEMRELIIGLVKMQPDLSTPEWSEKIAQRAARAIATGAIPWDTIEPKPGHMEMAKEIMDALVEAGVDREEIGAYTHANIISRNYKRFSKNSPLPPGCVALIKSGYPLAGCKTMTHDNSPLARSLSSGLVKGVSILLSRDENLEWQCPTTGATLPMVACHGRGGTIHAMNIIPAGSFSGVINLRDHEGDTALHKAVGQSSAPMVKRFLREGADPSLTNARGLTPLELLPRLRGKKAQDNFEAILQAFKEHGVDIGVGEDNPQALHAACRTLSIQTVKDLLRQGANPLERNGHGMNPVDLLLEGQPGLGSVGSIRATAKKQIAIIEALMDAGLDINSRHNRGKTMLHMAAGKYRWGVVLFLINHGADIMSIDDDGNHPFVELGENTNAKKYSYFARGQHKEIKQVLREICDRGFPMGEEGGNSPFYAIESEKTIADLVNGLRQEKQFTQNTAQVSARKNRPGRL